ncbi:MAG: polysaccharide deacetylase family protein [Rhodopseudomonas sp.]|uniref:polysaccharide deacetylase family protein n=1 Tax=Rhodopseudomonas sp. TaxID=1078 RepID=UPI0017D65192|nr:polysaccharide deacetylase family protein [Rhodopseudomonas sp.]NVN86693.1 polysaccharide deacetylase family protein [Rhodopseudomonas sp.]
MIVSRAAIVVLAAAFATIAQAADCPRPGTLGTSRVLAVDAARYPRVGLKSFPQTLPLQDHEVVLTFDDGPTSPMTEQVLAALAEECVRATFFLVGRPASHVPDLVRRIAAEGHTVGHHTWSHRNLAHIKSSETVEEIDRGMAAVDEIDRGMVADEVALHGSTWSRPSTPFFRFPYFESTPALLDLLESRGIVVFGTDLWASDWELMTPARELQLITERLKVAGKGIILFHDPRPQTAAMMPAFLRYLRENHYRVVHVVPATLAANYDGTP